MRRHTPAPIRKVLVVVTRGRGEDARVLMLRRAPPKPDEWQPVTGGVDKGESVEAAAAREAYEETSLRGKLKPLGLVHKFSKPLPDGTSFEFEEHAFAISIDEGEVVLSPEHRGFTWSPARDAADLVHWPHQREAILAATRLDDA